MRESTRKWCKHFQGCRVVLEGAGVLGGASIFFLVVLRFFFGWCFGFFFFLNFPIFFDIINLIKILLKIYTFYYLKILCTDSKTL